MSQTDWADDPYFGIPESPSIDGGTTSAGVLWHEIGTRWGHSMNAMCSYQGMFPAKLAHYFIQKHTKPGDVVLDPFSGRGTTALQARVSGRVPLANDLSPLAFVLSAAKANPPSWQRINEYVDELERTFASVSVEISEVDPDIQMLYHPRTLKQLVFLRNLLLSSDMLLWSPEQHMLAGSLAGIMHGAWRRDGSSQYLSISMPNTFSMSPPYVKKYISENNLAKIEQDVFARLREKLARLYVDAVDGPVGQVFHQDAVSLLSNGSIAPGSVDLVLTSPPYLGVVNYATANWIRLWLLGVDEVGREHGSGRKKLNADLDHRHSYTTYVDFIKRFVAGVENVLSTTGVAVIVIGDVADPGKEAVPLAARVWDAIKSETNLDLVEIIEDDLPARNKVSRIWGETKGQATNRDCALVLEHAGAIRDEFSVSWTEPYRDAGPDEAHVRSRRRGAAQH